jgi:hypothetical protein
MRRSRGIDPFGAWVVVDVGGFLSLVVIPGRAQREPGISRFPDAQLRIGE